MLSMFLLFLFSQRKLVKWSKKNCFQIWKCINIKCINRHSSWTLISFIFWKYCFVSETIHYSLRKNCPYSELFWSVFSRIRTEYGEIRSIQFENTDQNNSEYEHFSRSDQEHSRGVFWTLSNIYNGFKNVKSG